MSFSSTSASGAGTGIASLRDITNGSARSRAENFASYSTNTNHPATTSEGIENQDKSKMASDEDYASFLDRANEDPNKGVAKTQSSGKIQLKAVDHGVKVPAGLKDATKDAFYVSDADEPFEPVVLKHSGKSLPDEGSFIFVFQIRALFVVGMMLIYGICRVVCEVGQSSKPQGRGC